MLPSTDVAAFLKALHPDGVFEIRAYDCPEKAGGTFTSTHFGFFHDTDKAAREVARLDRLRPPGVYATLNPVSPSLLARSNNSVRAKAKKGECTSDTDVVRLRRLFIDIDSLRESGISATDDELASAVALADAVSDHLSHWPAPIRGMSGNGCYLVYPIDLPSDATSADLLHRVLAALTERFKSDDAAVDVTTFNPARIIKVLGTWARKGANTEAIELPGHGTVPARLHRQSWHEIPDGFGAVPVTAQQLLEIGGTEPVAVKASKAVKTSKVPDDIAAENAAFFNEDDSPSSSFGDFKIDDWIVKHGVPVGPPMPWHGGRLWEFTELPHLCEGKHANDRTGRITESADGKIGAGCFHDHCQWWNWHDLRAHYEPEVAERKAIKAEAEVIKTKLSVVGKPRTMNENEFLNALHKGFFKLYKIPGDDLTIRFELADDPERFGSYEIAMVKLRQPQAALDFLDGRFNVFIPTISKAQWNSACDYIRYNAERLPGEDDRDMRKSVGYGLLKAMAYSTVDIKTYIAEGNKEAPNYAGIFLYDNSLLVAFSTVLNKIKKDIVQDADRTYLSRVMQYCGVKRYHHRDRPAGFSENFQRFMLPNLHKLAELCGYESGEQILEIAKANLNRQLEGLGGKPTAEVELAMQTTRAYSPPMEFTGINPPSQSSSYTGGCDDDGDTSFDFG